MGITVSYQRISPSKFTEIQNNPESGEEFFDSIYVAKTRLSIQKEWQAIHYLLTGEIAFDESQAEPPLCNVVMGGNATKFEATYGYVRYFSPSEANELAQALTGVVREDLRNRFDLRGDREIYAQEDEWEFLMDLLESMICVFQEAAKNSEVILISSY
ncbi:DUF1877 family protein [Chamaesiphon sp. VAR_48_metabat_403]|uniref:DUF1877 family protein n=1 Tax=Chamaesiphon sp. VAR_48_metabat_403 TaxID=2964700 RepID=UPI00286D9861|nr:DUF1877 family protein [Chamaesiphon sp. VAR_48_metabat_403]